MVARWLVVTSGWLRLSLAVVSNFHPILLPNFAGSPHVRSILPSPNLMGPHIWLCRMRGKAIA